MFLGQKATHHQKLVGLNIRTDGEGNFFGMNDDVKTICRLMKTVFLFLLKTAVGQSYCYNLVI
jgi:hypothetical protein